MEQEWLRETVVGWSFRGSRWKHGEMLSRMGSSNLAVRKILLAITGKIGATGSQQPVGIREVASAGEGLGEDLSNAKRIQRLWGPERSQRRTGRPPGRAQTEERGPGLRALRLEGV